MTKKELRAKRKSIRSALDTVDLILWQVRRREDKTDEQIAFLEASVRYLTESLAQVNLRLKS